MVIILGTVQCQWMGALSDYRLGTDLVHVNIFRSIAYWDGPIERTKDQRTLLCKHISG